MYEEFFQFASSPFRLNPDPKFFFGSKSHNKAMAYLHYGLRQAEGFIVITGEIGAGKSMLIGHLLDQLDRSNVVAAHLLTTNLEPNALLSHILSAFRIEPSGKGESAAIEAFEDFLFDQMNRGRRVLLIVDEAQNLPIRTIEELRMLSNMDYDGTPLFQVFLVGQPEFRSILAKPDMEQFRQRVIASYHLEPLGESETREYIRHRLSVVGWSSDPTISEEAYAEIFRATGGVPRKINKLCNRIFLYCSIEKKHAIDLDVVKLVVADLSEESLEGAELKKPADSDGDAKASAKASAKAEPVTEAEPKKLAAAGGRRAKDNAGNSAPVVVPFDAARKANGGGPTKKRASAKSGEKSEAPAPASPNAKPAPKKAAPSAPAPKAVAPKAAPVNPPTSETPAAAGDESGEAPLSVFDRLRATKTTNQPAASREADVAALKEIAKAIEKASAENVEAEGGAADEAEPPSIGEPAIDEDPKGWRSAVVGSVNETRDELKSAHSNVGRVRRRLTELDERRREKRKQIAANLARAETILTELKNAWR